jgi:hypothetical protein
MRKIKIGGYCPKCGQQYIYQSIATNLMDIYMTNYAGLQHNKCEKCGKEWYD